MATTEKGIYYPDDKSAKAKILDEMKSMAESIDGIVKEHEAEQIKQSENIEALLDNQIPRRSGRK